LFSLFGIVEKWSRAVTGSAAHRMPIDEARRARRTPDMAGRPAFRLHRPASIKIW